jgi:hypothetical protein
MLNISLPIVNPQTSYSAGFVGAIAGRLDHADTHCDLANHSCIRPSASLVSLYRIRIPWRAGTRLCFSRLMIGICISEEEDERHVNSRPYVLKSYVDDRMRRRIAISRVRGGGTRLGDDVCSLASGIEFSTSGIVHRLHA